MNAPTVMAIPSRQNAQRVVGLAQNFRSTTLSASENLVVARAGISFDGQPGLTWGGRTKNNPGRFSSICMYRDVLTKPGVTMITNMVPFRFPLQELLHPVG